MHKLLQKIVVFALILVLLGTTTKVNAMSVSEIGSYQEELDILNKKWGTNYSIVADENGGYTEILSMTISEFDEYMENIYQIDNSTPELSNSILETDNSNGDVSLCGTSSKQRYYYSGSNYLYFSSEIYVVNGVQKYEKATGYGSHIASYPGYKCTANYTTTFSDNKTKATCSWKCTKMLSANISDATTYTIKCTFKAGGGNVYASGVA